MALVSIRRRWSSQSMSNITPRLFGPRLIDRCVFCGAKGTTKEHIFSKWTHRYLPTSKNSRASSSVGFHHIDRPPEIALIKLSGELKHWQVKCVCGETKDSCNNGWMRNIENKAKPILSKLITGEEIRLHPNDHEIIAAWAILKVIIAEFDAKADVTVNHMQRKYLMRHGRAPTRGWAVWIGSYERRDWIPEWVSRPMLIVPDKVAQRRKSYVARHFNSNSTTQVLGRLYIHVMHTPMLSLIKRWQFSQPHNGTLFRVWPPVESSIKWPGAPLDDEAADAIADGLFRHMSNVQAEWFASLRNASI
jgi:hypothetical protein